MRRILNPGCARQDNSRAEPGQSAVCRRGDDTIDSSTGRGPDARLSLVRAPASYAAGAEAGFIVDVSNAGRATWLATRGSLQKGEVWLESHLIGRAGDIVWDYARAYLTDDVRPGETARLEMRVRLPERPGGYVIEFDPVCEQIAWFQDIGSRPLRLEVTVS